MSVTCTNLEIGNEKQSKKLKKKKTKDGIKDGREKSNPPNMFPGATKSPSRL